MSDAANQRGRRTKWTDKMCVDLEKCKMKAVELNNSSDLLKIHLKTQLNASRIWTVYCIH